MPPDAENNVHHNMNFLPNVHQQIFELLFDGKAQQLCDGTCDPD
jgi:hypothetical protein